MGMGIKWWGWVPDILPCRPLVPTTIPLKAPCDMLAGVSVRQCDNYNKSHRRCNKKSRMNSVGGLGLGLVLEC